MTKQSCKCNKCDEKAIIITVEGGLIQNINNPTSHKIIVKDYDIDGSEECLKEDANGDSYTESIW